MQIPEIDRSMHTPLVFSQLEDSLDTVQEGKAMVDKKALKQESAKGFTPQKSMRMEKMGSKLDDTDGASEAPSGSMAKSKMTKKTRKSKMSASSKLQQGAVRRTRKAPTFSAWEAQNYIPIIKQSWLDILKQVSIEEVGVVFYDKLFDVGGEGLKHMFTTERSIMAVKV